MSTGRLYELMRGRFPAEEFALFFEVPNATGARANRWADALVIGLWPSRGLHVHGFEMKVSRSDWLRELKEPSKAESIAKYCDHWSLLVSDPEIVKPGELPSTWGLWAPRGKGLTCLKEAPKLEAKPVDRVFLAALARAAQKSAEITIRRSAEAQEFDRRPPGGEGEDPRGIRGTPRAIHRERARGRQPRALPPETAHRGLRGGIGPQVRRNHVAGRRGARQGGQGRARDAPAARGVDPARQARAAGHAQGPRRRERSDRPGSAGMSFNGMGKRIPPIIASTDGWLDSNEVRQLREEISKSLRAGQPHAPMLLTPGWHLEANVAREQQLWQCAYCGGTEVHARDSELITRCRSCGAPRPVHTRPFYFIPEKTR